MSDPNKKPQRKTLPAKAPQTHRRRSIAPATSCANTLTANPSQDHTAWKQIEAELRESQSKFRIMADYTFDWEYWLTPDGNLAYVSPSSEQVTGYRPEEFQSDPHLLEMITHPDDRAMMSQHLRDSLASPLAHTAFDFRILARDGTQHWVAHNCRPVYHTDGSWLGRRSSNHDITEQKQTEQALRFSESKYRNIVESSKDGILLIDETGIIVEWNQSQAQITGLKTAEVIGKPIQDIWLRLDLESRGKPHAFARFQNVLRHIAMTGDVSQLSQYEYRSIQHMDGLGQRIIQFIVFPIASGSGYMIGSICRDITEQHRAEEALALEKERLDVTLQSIGDGMITTDLHQQIILFNPVAEQLTGWARAEAIGKPLVDVFHIVNRKTREVVPNPAQAALASGKILGMPDDTMLVAQDGTERIISSSIAPIRGRRNEITGVALVLRDITRLRQAEEALRESREYARRLIDSSLDMIIAVDNDGKITEFNRAAQQTFDYQSEEIIGSDVSVLYAEPGDSASVNHRTFETGGLAQEVLHRRKNGQVFPALLSTSVLRDGDGQPVGIMGVSRDITRLKQAEEQNVRAERLSALGRMAATLAHEINNPLQAIQSNLDLILDFPLADQEREENLQIIRQEIDRLNEVTQRVLQFARPARISRRLTNLSDLIQQTLALADKHLQHSQIVVTHELQNISQISAAPEQIAQTLLNIVLNAIEATGPGGRIGITLRAEANHAVITITNNGPLIPSEDLPHIFEPFFTTKQDGSGLGLSISRSIIEQHGGTITAENLGAERGSRFTIQLPMAEPNGDESRND